MPLTYSLQALLQTIAFPLAIDDVGLVGQSIQQRCGHHRITKDLSPVGKAKIGRDDHRPFFLALSKHLKEKFRTFPGKWDIAKLIQNQQIIAGMPLDKALQVFLLASFDQFVYQPIAADKPSPVIILTGLDPKGGGQMGLAGATTPEENDIPPFLNGRRINSASLYGLLWRGCYRTKAVALFFTAYWIFCFCG